MFATRLLVVVMLTSLSAAASTRVALLKPKTDGAVSASLSETLAEVVATDLSKDEHFAVVSSADIDAVLGFDRQRSLLGCDEASCFTELAGALGTDEVAILTIGALGSMRVVTLRRIDARTGKAIRRESETVDGEDLVVPALRKMTARAFGLKEVVTASSRRVNPGWFVLGGAAALGVAGLGVGLSSWSDYQAFKANPFDDALGDRARLKAYVADGLYAGALVTAVVAVVVLVVNRAPAGEVTP